MIRPRKTKDQLRQISPRGDCKDVDLWQALVNDGHPVLGITVLDGVWWLAFGVRVETEGGRYYEDATEEEMAAAVAAARTAKPDSRPRLKAELLALADKRVRLEAAAKLAPGAYTKELADLAAEEAQISAKLKAAMGA